MYFDEYGSDNEQIIVMLHGANFVHCFKKQYVLAEQYHIIVPHLMGYGNETDKTFHTGEQIAELTHFILSFGEKVMLVGFSLGAQIGFTNIALCARKDNEIIAVAGASAVSGKIAEVGIDVKKEWRGYGLAGLLVRNLTVELLERNVIPFYSASVTNLASQAVAIRSGYMPLWTDSYGVR